VLEVLEDRRLMTASLAPISNLTVPAQLGYQLPLDGSGNSNPQTFQPSSSNPDIRVSVATGQFWTIKVSHQASSTPGDITFTNAPMTFQFFSSLTPNTVSQVTSLTNSGFYVNQGMFFPRILKGFVAQGGSTFKDNTNPPPSSSGVPSIATEPVQQLAFTGSNQLAMANTGSPNSNQAQFFITDGVLSTSTQQSLDFNYTIFGQLVSGQQTATDLSNVTVHSNGSTTMPETSVPDSPVTITSAMLSDTNPNGVLLIDTTSAKAGETATITVTATDSKDHTTVTQSFTVTVDAYNGPPNSVTQSVPVNSPTEIQLQNALQNRPSTGNSIANFNFSYQLVTQPAHGTISQFNSSAGSLVYTPNSGYRGPDSFQYKALAQAPNSAPATAISLPGAAQVIVGESTGAVRTIGTVLVVDPVPRSDHGTNNIQITQFSNVTTGGQSILVTVNGIPDFNAPSTTAISQIVVFGSKANDNITVDPSVTKPATLDGGHGGKNVVRGGGGQTLEHGWFGHTLLVGGVGPNELVGRKGIVRFKPSSSTGIVFAGVPKPRNANHQTVSPGGTFYRFVHGHLVPVWSLGSASAPTGHTRSRHPRSTKK
jgi:cyclophilin family peptidyl-prolyl cis-trans isomerase